MVGLLKSYVVSRIVKLTGMCLPYVRYPDIPKIDKKEHGGIFSSMPHYASISSPWIVLVFISALFFQTGCITLHDRKSGEAVVVDTVGAVGTEEIPQEASVIEVAPAESVQDEVSYEELTQDEVTTPEDPIIVHPYELPIYGWVEWACILPDAVRMKAKLDSGAKTSSISAHDIVHFERDGQRWVRFLMDNPETGLSIEMERPLSRRVRIIRHESEPQRRPVVELEVIIGDVHQKVEFSLIDRNNFIYPILIGRNFMRGKLLLDTDNTFLAPRACE